MLRRLKQNIKEKTGRAQKTPLPTDVERGMAYATDMRSSVEKLLKATDGLIKKWKSSGMTEQEKVAEPCGILAAKASRGPFAENMKALQDLHNDLGRIERRNYEEIHKKMIEDCCQYFLKHESVQAIDACNLLKKKRLDRDATQSELASKSTPERQQRAGAAEAEFEAAIGTARSEFTKFPDQQRQHVRALKLMLDAMLVHYTDCTAAAKNTVDALNRAEMSSSSSSGKKKNESRGGQ